MPDEGKAHIADAFNDFASDINRATRAMNRFIVALDHASGRLEAHGEAEDKTDWATPPVMDPPPPPGARRRRPVARTAPARHSKT